MREMIETRRCWRIKAGDASLLEFNDAANSKRLRMLMDWWQLTGERCFADSIMEIARNPVQGFSIWSDGDILVEFISLQNDKNYSRPFIYETEFLELLEKGLTNAIYGSSIDTLSMFVDLVDAVDTGKILPISINHALQIAVLEEFKDNFRRVYDDNSESSLYDRSDALKS
ncbi:hypothetical protein J4731_08365 [Providencia rettgeri]|nr:hypothetical protein [Providencia rettgeri]